MEILKIIIENNIIGNLLVGVGTIFVGRAAKKSSGIYKTNDKEKKEEALLIDKNKIIDLSTTVIDVFEYGGIIIPMHVYSSNPKTPEGKLIATHIDNARNEFNANIKELRKFLIYNKHKIPEKLAKSINNYVKNVIRLDMESTQIKLEYMCKHKNTEFNDKGEIVIPLGEIKELDTHIKQILKQFEKNKDDVLKLLTEIERDYEKY